MSEKQLSLNIIKNTNNGISSKAHNNLLLIGAFISFSSIYQMGVSNAYVNTATDEFYIYLNNSLSKRGINMSDSVYIWVWSFILNSWFPGFAIGSFLAIPVTDKFGRKIGLFTGNSSTLLSIVIMLLGIGFEEIEFFFIGRFISAISSAISMCSLILFLQEISPSNMRGKLSFFSEMSFVCTSAIGMIMGMPVVLGNNLLFLIGIAIIPSLLSIVLIYPLYETPKFLLLKRNDIHKAFDAIKHYMKTDDIYTKKIFNQIQEISQLTKSSSIIDIFRISYVRLALILGIMSLQITISFWPIVFYSTDFLRLANVSNDLAEFVSSGLFFVSAISTFCGLLLIERFNRRNILLLSSILNICTLIAFVLFTQLQNINDNFKYGCIVVLFCHNVTYSFALGPVAWFITAELVPTEYRCSCQSVALFFNSFMTFVINLVVMPLYQSIGSYAFFPLFIIPSIIACIVLYIWLPETKNRDIQQIINNLRGFTKDETWVEYYNME